MTDVAAVNPVPTRRVFKAWEEDWEKSDFKKDTPTARSQFVAKHVNLVWLDVDVSTYPKLEHRDIQMRGKGRDRGWHVIAWNIVGKEEDVWRPSAVTDAVKCQVLGKDLQGKVCPTLKQPDEAGIRVVLKDEVRRTTEESDTDGDD